MAVLPVRTIIYPAALDGQENGKLPDSILVDTPGQAGGPTVRLLEPAARAWRALCAAALKEGHVLKATSLVDSYRPYEVQERIFLQRFTTSPVSSTRRYWRGQWWYLKPGYALAAVPGTSNHGRALAVDAGEERDGDTGTESIDDATVAWLVANEERFGFSHEVPSEPWHIRYFAGDTVPPAVIAWERAAPTPGDDDDMTPDQAEQLKEAAMQVNRIATVLGIDDLKAPLPEGLSRNLAARLDDLHQELGAGREGLSGNALARLDRVWALVTAAAVAPTSLTDADLADVAKAVADEQARRLTP